MIKIPSSLLQDLASVQGFDERAFIDAHQSPAPTSVRINPAKDTGLFTGCAPVTWCEGGVYLPERPVFTLDPAFHAGAYYVQEASSMFLTHMFNSIFADTKNLRVLDLCAAPGGKSTLIASLLDKSSLLVSNDVIRTRASVLEENMTRWGYTNTWVTSNDPRDFARLEGYFDLIIADAPCSGSGLWRKDEEALGEWSEANVQLCSERQQRILADIWPSLKQGGVLIYATCSYSTKEDEDVLDWLAATYDTETIAIPLKEEWGIVPVSSHKNMAGYRFFPGHVRGEGLFIAAVRKLEGAGEKKAPRFKPQNDRKIQQQAGHLLSDSDMIYIPAGKDEYCAIYPWHEQDMHLLDAAVYLRKKGLYIGSPTAKEWLPAHDIALSIDASKTLPSAAVTKEQALKFLKKEEMNVEIARGWHLVRYNGLGLGWVKSLGNRVNNYLPKNWRIRMDIS